MINTKYYDGFEGEPEVVLFNDHQRFIMWNGYFESLLDSLLDTNLEKEGILEEYYNHEGWYDDSPWMIPDVPLTIWQLKHFDLNKVNQSENIKVVLPELAHEIILFLENSKEKVWIEYD
ncbi:hypothetical protein CHI12_06695 [Terribacillus saccharophilus]|uniref:Uncharacterized protein n=1 Tax=Terribacillus saccharophilus TaxID=361277 RepID=A0A268HEL6_9BACI|nr:hypothetical protein [Terribacillus saccharophilus]PAE08308.1 hypothetical protein CHI12_06695 [Terribacillus saccharophilus]